MQASTPPRWGAVRPASVACWPRAAMTASASPARMRTAWAATGGLGGRVGVVVGAPGRLPHVLQGVGEVDQDVGVDAAAGGFGADEVELVAGAVDQHDPGAPVGRVTLGGLVEHGRDDLLAGGGDRAGQPLCRGDRTLAARPTTPSVGVAWMVMTGVRTSWGRRGAGSASSTTPGSPPACGPAPPRRPAESGSGPHPWRRRPCGWPRAAPRGAPPRPCRPR